MRKTLTDRGVEKLEIKRGKAYAQPDPELTGHYVRVQPTGAKSFAVAARDPSGKQKWATIGAADVLSIEDARKQARVAIARIRSGEPAFEAPAESFEAEARRWLDRHVKKKRLRSERHINRLLELHVFSFWRGRPFLSIKRSDVTALLDDVEDGHSARQADSVLSVISPIMHWYAARSDSYLVPIVRGMRRRNPKEHARARTLNDDELRTVWKAGEADGMFGAFVRIALLTAQRRAKLAAMKWADISEDGEWTIPQEPREKDSAGSLMLPPAALDIIRALPQIGNNPFVFAGRGDGQFNGFSKSKRRFDASLSSVKPWVLHDLRRTARSLMSRAGVLSEHAERVMGHAIAGVEGVYDRHSYKQEKADALRKLASLIDGIVNPRAKNVVPITKRAKRR